MDDTPTFKGRECGKCTLCCKVLRIAALGKPAGSWCPNCAVGRGCGIYETRPDECRNFFCGFLAWDVLGPHWFPALCKMVVIWDPKANRIAVHVDVGRPSAWLDEPYHSEIRHWAASAVDTMMQILVVIGQRTIVMLPQSDVDLGIVAEDEQIVTSKRMTAQGLVYDAMKLRTDDHRLAGLKPGNWNKF